MTPEKHESKIRSADDMQNKVLSPLKDQWMGRLDAALSRKSRFQKIADQCDYFFRGDLGFMWSGEFKSQYMPRMSSPGIQVSIAKAFELVAIFGPTLFWQNPHRQVRSHRGVDPEPVMNLFQNIGLPPELQQLAQEDEKRKLQAEVRNSLLQIYLNWSQYSQPQNGLAREAELIITEALVKGRGCAWTQDYKHPASDDVYTGTFYDSVDNLLIDPDCTDPELRTATWISRRHLTPVWEVERVFGLEKGSLKDYATHSSSESESRSGSDKTKQNTNDLMEWHEVWSRGGVGSLMRDAEYSMGEAIDKVVGDFAYCCVCKTVPYFLNAPPEKMFKASEQAMRDMFAWRAANYGSKWEAWRDSQWPVVLLDFYPVPNSAWPLAPLAPGLGELICMNVLTTAFVEQAWENRKQIIAVLKNAAADIKAALQRDDTTVTVEVQPQANMTIDKTIQFLNRNPGNKDILEALDRLSEQFDKRVGLSEILYSMSPTQIRVAADANVKQQNASIRPEKMGKSVASFMSRVAANEACMAATFVKAKSIRHLLGPIGTFLWKHFVENADTHAMMREMLFVCEASDIMRPNRERDLANLQGLSQYFVPAFTNYAQVSGDSAPLNEFLQSIAEAMDHDTSGWNMGPWMPQPDPAAQQAAQEQAMVEMQNKQADTMLKQAQTQLAMATAGSKQAEPQLKQLEFQFDAQQKQMDMQLKMTEARMKLQQQHESHQTQLVQKTADHILKTEQSNADHMLKLVQDGTLHEQQLEQSQETHDQQLKQQKAQGKLAIELMRQQAKAKPNERSEDN